MGLERLLWGITTLLLVILPSTAIADEEDLYDYGKTCYERMKVPVPEINCLSEKATLLKVTVNGKEVPDGRYVAKCDRPAGISQGGYPCAPGGRLLKWVSKNDRGEEVTTVAICRRYRNRKLDDPNFDDIGVIQFNSKTNEACWFARTDPSDEGWNGTKIPSPYQPGRRKGETADRKAKRFWSSPKTVASGQCISCHSAGIWIRTPFVTQAKRDKKNDNGLPDINHGRVKHLGKSFSEWRENPPFQIKINRAAYDALYPPTDEDKAAAKRARGMADVDRCTECHYLGQHKWAGSGGYCGSFVPLSAGLRRASAAVKRDDYHDAWMPPALKYRKSGEEAKFRDYYKRALEAAKRCCENPRLTARIEGKPVQVCLDKFDDAAAPAAPRRGTH